MAQATAPILDSTFSGVSSTAPLQPQLRQYRTKCGFGGMPATANAISVARGLSAVMFCAAPNRLAAPGRRFGSRRTGRTHHSLRRALDRPRKKLIDL